MLQHSRPAALVPRRIGRNELYTFDVLQELADAQKDYADLQRQSSGEARFAQKILSDPDKCSGGIGTAFAPTGHWKSRRSGGRPRIDREIRDLIRRISKENPLWGAPRIHGELLMLGIEVAQSTVARYMARRQGPPSQGWKTFLRNHATGIASIDLFVVRTISIKLLCLHQAALWPGHSSSRPQATG
jgi:hypothetical protein